MKINTGISNIYYLFTALGVGTALLSPSLKV
jgi:hypothetical protein